MHVSRRQTRLARSVAILTTGVSLANAPSKGFSGAELFEFIRYRGVPFRFERRRG
jgi:hypothetical protein